HVNIPISLAYLKPSLFSISLLLSHLISPLFCVFLHVSLILLRNLMVVYFFLPFLYPFFVGFFLLLVPIPPILALDVCLVRLSWHINFIYNIFNKSVSLSFFMFQSSKITSKLRIVSIFPARIKFVFI